MAAAASHASGILTVTKAFPRPIDLRGLPPEPSIEVPGAPGRRVNRELVLASFVVVLVLWIAWPTVMGQRPPQALDRLLQGALMRFRSASSR